MKRFDDLTWTDNFFGDEERKSLQFSTLIMMQFLSTPYERKDAWFTFYAELTLGPIILFPVFFSDSLVHITRPNRLYSGLAFNWLSGWDCICESSKVFTVLSSICVLGCAIPSSCLYAMRRPICETKARNLARVVFLEMLEFRPS